jgi:hypothetical protein
VLRERAQLVGLSGLRLRVAYEEDLHRRIVGRMASWPTTRS